MPIINPNKKTSVSSTGASGSGQLSSGNFNNKNVTVAAQKDAAKLVKSDEVSRHSPIQQNVPVAPPRRKRAAKTPGASNVTSSTPSSSVTQPKGTDVPIEESLYDYTPATQPQEDSRPRLPTPPSSPLASHGRFPTPPSSPSPENLYDDPSQLPTGLQSADIYEATPQLPSDLQSEDIYEDHPQLPADSQPQNTDSQYSYISHDSQTAGHGSQATGGTASNYETVTGSDEYDYIEHGGQSASGTGHDYATVASGSQDIYSAYSYVGPEGQTTSDNPIYETIPPHMQSGRPSVPDNLAAAVSHITEEANNLTGDATRYLGQLEIDILNIIEDTRFQELPSSEVGNLDQRVTEQHKFCVDAFTKKCNVMHKQLQELVKEKGLTNTERRNAMDNLTVITAMQAKFSAMSKQLAAALEKIQDGSFFEGIDIEKPIQPKVLTELASVRTQLEEVPQSIEEADKTIETLQHGVEQMKKAGYQAEVYRPGLEVPINKVKDNLKNMLPTVDSCIQILASAQRDFKNSLRPMSVTESTYTKELHSQQLELASSCRAKIHNLLSAIDNL